MFHLQEHNKTLSVNLEQHAAVLERLIGLNAELMDQLNARTAAKSQPPRPPDVALQVLDLPSQCAESGRGRAGMQPRV